MPRNKKPYTWNPYGAGDKIYGFGRNAPNVGRTSDRTGYAERDRQARLRRNALLRKMKMLQKTQGSMRGLR